MFDSTVKVFGLALLTIASCLVYYGYSSPTTVAAATVATVVTNSDPAHNKAAYYSLKNYGYIRGQTSWPQRWDGCVSAKNDTFNPVIYKTFPWLPQNNNGTPTSGSPSSYDGNTITRSGDCHDRYVDGGGSSGGWANPTALGYWAYPSGAGFSGSAYSGFSSIMSCNNGYTVHGGNAPVIWGSSGVDYNDQAYGWGGLMAQNGWSSTVQASPNNFLAYSNGTTFFQNSFTLTTAQYNAISAGSTVGFYGVADDWMRVYLNGYLIGTTPYDYSGYPINQTIPASYFKDPAGGTPNRLAIQVSDKIVWTRSDTSTNRGSGVCYNMTVDMPVAPPPQWSLSGTTTVDETTVQPGQTINWNHFITNNGPTATNATITAQVHQTVNGVDTSVGSPSSTAAGVASGGTVTTQNGSYAVTVADMGKTICQYIYWYPNTQAGWSGTSMRKCADVAKQPLVQVWGGDLRVGDGYTTITANSSASINTGVPLTIGANMYGSWGEYGMFAPTSGSIASTSGGVLSGSSGGPAGLSSTQRNPLTFANTPSFGHWGTPNVLPAINSYSFSQPTTSVGTDFPISGSTKSGVYIFTKPVTQVKGTLFGSNTLILKSAGTVEISADLLYGATASYSSFDSIPQIIIIANKIIIDSNVSQVNAWLIAVPNAFGSGGSISTCNTIVPSPGHYFDGLTVNDVCSQKQLTVVGPVMAKELQLRRTFGADSTNGQATPAEIFNLRADAYAWASSQGDPNAISTMQTIELPPRF